ncbi:uncharacterized protein SPSK_03670 [Sporothrix schenckii 1099-18]|uniref:Uncharacterized protein n=1 Tax=Sporothrix schenckii 1099-18 TaxID=1397361 RepID=A0A0F2LY54_SPOSC|nr:uncharacterized protein SPSK_03670 [Sporothrix schenckii 1099-18]KJR82388.1 hypothetical protein SPSK_03670 [Sporothrix schenckii 1099-18]
MSSISQLDGTCSATGCNSDGPSDEPCDQCTAAVQVQLSTSTPENKAVVDTNLEAVAEPSPKEPEPLPTKVGGISGEPAGKKLKTIAKQLMLKKTNCVWLYNTLHNLPRFLFMVSVLMSSRFRNLLSGCNDPLSKQGFRVSSSVRAFEA